MADMEKHLFNLKFTAKSLQRDSKRCQKEESAEKAKLKKAIQQGNMEGARIYAQNAIRKKNEALNLLRLSSRVDGVASRVQTAVSMRKVTNSMAGVVKGLDQAMKTMNLEKISLIMDAFEKQSDDLNIQTTVMEQAASNSTSMETPSDQVDLLMQQVADEHGLELNMGLDANSVPAGKVASSADKEQDALNERLARLRNAA